MSREQIFSKLTTVFQSVFDDDSIELYDGTSSKDIDEWDSLTHITLISEIEDEFSIHFEMKDITKMQNVGELVDKIQELIQL